MNKLEELIKNFEEVEDWQDIIKSNFDRKSGIYSFAVITEIVAFQGDIRFIYPTKITLEYGYVNTTKKIETKERFFVKGKTFKIIEKKTIIPFGSYKREGTYSGELFEVISDLVQYSVDKKALFSSSLLPVGDNPLYGIDSKQKWPSYILVLEKNKLRPKEMHIDQNSLYSIDLLNEELVNFGINYTYHSSNASRIIIIFALPYIRILENKIHRENGNESISLLLEINRLGPLLTSKLNIEVESKIKNIKNDIIYDDKVTVDFNNRSYQIVEIKPDAPNEIGFSSIKIKINGVIVNNFSGFYIRNISFDIKTI